MACSPSSLLHGRSNQSCLLRLPSRVGALVIVPDQSSATEIRRLASSSPSPDDGVRCLDADSLRHVPRIHAAVRFRCAAFRIESLFGVAPGG